MSTAFWDRRVKLTIAPPIAGTFRTQPTQSAMVITDLRVRFNVTKTLRKEPNHSKVEVYNLSPVSRGQLQEKGSRLWLEAGYATTTAQLFSGDVRFVSHTKQEADWISTFELGDGERAYVHGRVNRSFKAGTTKADILKALVAQSGWDTGNIADFYASLGQKALSGYVAWGNANREIDRLLKAHGLTFSVQDGAVQILPLTGYTPQSAVLVDEDHGLVGSPEFGSAPTKGKKRTLKVRSLLNVQIVKPGQRIMLKSAAYTGQLVIQKLDINGDTYGEEWYQDMECLP